VPNDKMLVLRLIVSPHKFPEFGTHELISLVRWFYSFFGYREWLNCHCTDWSIGDFQSSIDNFCLQKIQIESDTMDQNVMIEILW